VIHAVLDLSFFLSSSCVFWRFFFPPSIPPPLFFFWHDRGGSPPNVAELVIRTSPHTLRNTTWYGAFVAALIAGIAALAVVNLSRLDSSGAIASVDERVIGGVQCLPCNFGSKAANKALRGGEIKVSPGGLGWDQEGLDLPMFISG